MKRFLLSFSFIFFLSSFLFPFDKSPYYIESGELRIGLKDTVYSLKNSFLNCFSFDFMYGVNKNVLLEVAIPYLFFEYSYSEGVLGDISILGKFSIEKDFKEFCRISFVPYFRFPTGIIKDESFRYVKGERVSFYPFSTGVFTFYPGFNMSLFFEPFMIWFTFYYCNERKYEEDILSFNSSLDRLEFTFGIDYMFEFNIFSGKLFYTPELNFVYRQNISDEKILSDGLILYFLNNFKINKSLKFRLGFIYPIIFEKNIEDFAFLLSFSFII